PRCGLPGRPGGCSRRFAGPGSHTPIGYWPIRRWGANEVTRGLPPPWRAEKFSGGYVVRDANGIAVAYVYGRSTEDEAITAKQMTMDEARRVASDIAKLPETLKREH